MYIDFLSVAGGLLFLFLGGESLVRGSVSVAKQFGLSEIFVGLTIVGFGTSAPEFLVSLDAALRGAPEIALGNVVGSNIANTLLIIGTAAIILPLSTCRKDTLRDAAMGIGAALALFAVVQGHRVSRLEGLALVTLMAVFLYATYKQERRGSTEQAETDTEATAHPRAWLGPVLALIGILLLIAGAEMLVNGAVSLAHSYGVPERVIGLTMVALGTSLPELAAAIAAALNRRPGVVLGNVLGSNIFNLLAIIGLTAAIVPIETSAPFRGPYMLCLVGIAVGLLVLLCFIGRIGRLGGVAMVAAYAAYSIFLFA